jgi:hypothetical protein
MGNSDVPHATWMRLARGATAVLLLCMTAAAQAQDTYGNDRAQIEDLQARYLFALDFRDA